MTLDNSEITFRIFDTLFGTKDWPKLNKNEIQNKFINSYKGEIKFEYAGKQITIKITSNYLK